jgi:hypothetical protein
MALDRALGDAQFDGDLPVAQRLGDQGEQFAFTRRECFPGVFAGRTCAASLSGGRRLAVPGCRAANGGTQ